MDPVQSLLAWYVQLAKQPGWKAYVWDRVNVMARECPALFGEFPRLLTEAMQKESAHEA